MALKKQAKKQAKSAKKQLEQREELVRRLVQDQDLQDDLRAVAEAGRKAYARIAGNGVGALLQDEKVHKNVRAASDALMDAKDSISGKKRKRKGGLVGLLTLGLVGAGAAAVAVPSLRSKVLDLIFGPEEELDYSAGAPAATAPGT